MTYDINDMNLEVDINVSLPLGTMLALENRRKRVKRGVRLQRLEQGDSRGKVVQEHEAVGVTEKGGTAQ
jgi:hypothetical protein